MKKKVLSLVLAFAMVLPFVPVFEAPVFAEKNALKWILDASSAAKKEKYEQEKKEQKAEIVDKKYKDKKEQELQRESIVPINELASESDFYYEVVDGEAIIRWASESIEGDLVIPTTLGGYPVTTIGYQAFADCNNLTSVTIGSHIKSIEDLAFYRCTNLEKVEVGAASIDWGAFVHCHSLKELVLLDGVTSIDSEAFYDCPSLESLTVASGNSAYHSAGNCIIENDSKTLVLGCQTSVIPSDGSVTSIGENAFNDCIYLRDVVIPNKVTSIGFGAFSGCVGLTNLTIPDNVTSIGSSAFSGCTSLETVKLSENIQKIESYTFSGCFSLKSITIPAKVTEIGGAAFQQCESLTSVIIPKNVSTIEGNVFSDCPSLESLTVASGNYAYHSAGNCIIETASKTLLSGCKKSVIPADGSVTSIAYEAFYGCVGLTSVTIPDGVTVIGSGAFYNCSSLTSITIPDSVTDLGSDAFSHCASLKSAKIGKEAWIMNGNVFSYCPSLESLTVASGNSMYHSAGNCVIETESKTLIIGCKTSLIPSDGSVTSIGDSAFEGSGLTDLTIPGSVTLVGLGAFYDCALLVELTISDGVATIERQAFYNCSSLTSVTIPDSVTVIGPSAFYGTAYYDNEDNWENGVLYIGRHLIDANYDDVPATYTVRPGTKTIADSAFEGCFTLTDLTIPAGVSICDSAFSDCNNLETVTVLAGGGVSIGEYAFSHCSALTSIHLPDDISAIGWEAFFGSAYYEDETNWDEGLLYVGNHLIKANENVSGDLILKDGTKLIADYAFEYGHNLGEVIFPDGLTGVGKYAFANSSLTKVAVGEGNVVIGESAFFHCDSLAEIDLSNVTSIGDAAFFSCEALTEIDLSNVTFIGEDAFCYCSSLKNVDFGTKLKSIGPWAFSGCLDLGSAQLPDSVTFIGKYAFSDCVALKSVFLPDGITSIDENAFYSCLLLQSVVIPDSVTTIGEQAFAFCLNLNSIAIPSDISKIGSDAFTYCEKLTDVWYSGTVSDRSHIKIFSPNEELDSAAWHYVDGNCDFDCNECGATRTAPHDYDNCCDPDCNLCGEKRTVKHFIRVANPIAAHTLKNDSKYPFNYDEGAYYSTNKGNKTTSSFVITAEHDCELLLAYTVSSEANYDKLIIKKGSVQLDAISGEELNVEVMFIPVVKGEKVTISYAKDGRTSKGEDMGMFAFRCFCDDKKDVPIDPEALACGETSVCAGCKTVLGENHSYDNDCDATCNACGATRKIDGHNFTDWSSVVSGGCNNVSYSVRACIGCGYSETDPSDNEIHPHNWVLEHKAATCTVAGYKNYIYCSNCGAEANKSVEPALGHDFGDPYFEDETKHLQRCQNPGCDATEEEKHNYSKLVSSIKPTCTEDGLEIYACKCSRQNEKVLEAPGHDLPASPKTSDWQKDDSNHWLKCGRCEYITNRSVHGGEWKEKSKATHTESGLEEKVCPTCGHTAQREIPPVDNCIPDEEWIKNKTHHWKNCQVPECNAELNKTLHTYGEWKTIKLETCTENGVKERTCSVCGNVETEPIDEIDGHDFPVSPKTSDWVKEDDEHWLECSRCGEKKNRAAHSYGEWKIIKSETCTEAGEKERICTVCENVDKESIPPAHDLPASPKTSDWQKDDAEHWLKCSRCTYTERHAAHSYGEWNIIKSETCTEAGEKERICSVCGNVDKEPLPPGHDLPAFPKTSDWQKDDAEHWLKCGRCDYITNRSVHGGEWKEKTAATHTESGLEEKVCPTCGHTAQREIPPVDKCIPAEKWSKNETHHWKNCLVPECDAKLNKTLHTYGEWETIKPETCTENGVKERACTVCGNVETEPIDEIDGHDFPVSPKTSDWVKEDDEHWLECSRCGEKKNRAAHSYGEWNIIKSETCTEAGEKERICSVCENVDKEPIPPAHDLPASPKTSDWQKDDAEHWLKCGRCDYITNRSVHGGEWKEKSKATHTKSGLEEKVCPTCGHTAQREIPPVDKCIPAEKWSQNETHHWKNCLVPECVAELNKTLHTYDEWEPIKPETCTVNGVKERTCTVCGNVETEPIDEIDGHDFPVSPKTSDWVNNGTSHWLECSRCGEKKNRAAHGGEWKEKVAATHTKSGLEEKICPTCGYFSQKETPPVRECIPDDEWYKGETNHWKQCKYSGCETLFNKGNHIFDKVVETKAETCTEDGWRITECKCGAQKIETIPKPDHPYGKYAWNDVYHWRTCSECGVKETENHNYSISAGYQKETCTKDGWRITECKCGAQKKELFSATGHEYYYDIRVSETTANGSTCSVFAVTELCRNCNHRRVVSENVMHIHGGTELIILEGVEPTCTTPGLDVGAMCPVEGCGEILIAQKEIPQLGHSYADHACVTVCSRCGATRVSQQEHTYTNVCDDTCDVCGEKRVASNHDYSNACDTTCNVCGTTRTTNHDYSLRDKNTETHWLKCSVCGAIDETTRNAHKYKNACDADCDVCGEMRVVDPHVFSVQNKNRAEHWMRCSICSIIDESSRKAHGFDNACDATCDECGYVRAVSHDYTSQNKNAEAHWLKCSVCDDIDVSSREIHCYDNICDADCNECGYMREVIHDYSESEQSSTEHWTKCTICGKIDEDHRENHDFDNACDATCDECGYARQVPDHVYDNADDLVCNVCGYERPSYIPADLDGDEGVTIDDAIYLLFYVNFQDFYPVNQPVDFDGNGEVNMDDAIYLLFHVNFPSFYPLH